LGPLPPGMPRALGPRAQMQLGAAWEPTAAPAHPDPLAASPMSGAPDAARAEAGSACAEPERWAPAGRCAALAGPASREDAAGAGPASAPGARPRLAPRRAPLPSWAEALPPLGTELARLDRAAADLILRLLAYDPARRGPQGSRTTRDGGQAVRGMSVCTGCDTTGAQALRCWAASSRACRRCLCLKPYRRYGWSQNAFRCSTA